MNIDATRIPIEDEFGKKYSKYIHKTTKAEFDGPTGGFGAGGLLGVERTMFNDQGRFPSNVIGEVEDYQNTSIVHCRHTGFEAPPPEKFNNPERCTTSFMGLCWHHSHR